MSDISDSQRIDHRRLDEIHNCVVLGCERRARLAFVASEDGELAGLAWRTGDMIDLCPEHGRLVYQGRDPLWG